VFRGKREIETILRALGEQLEAVSDEPVEFVVCGGSALNVLGFVQRATKDVDILAFIKRNTAGTISFTKNHPVGKKLSEASRKVAKDFNLPEDWINTDPTSAVDFGLPDGLMERATIKQFGKSLIIHFLGRFDQIHFKLYAAADQGAGKHFDDLRALHPTAEELEQAARWSMTHDVSEDYRQTLKEMLDHMGYGDVAQRI
jgi:hypothetical protein